MADAEVLKIEPVFGGSSDEPAKTEEELKKEEAKTVEATTSSVSGNLSSLSASEAKEVAEVVEVERPPAKEFVPPRERPPATVNAKPLTEAQLELHKKLEVAMDGRLESEIPLKDEYWTIRNEVLLAR